MICVLPFFFYFFCSRYAGVLDIEKYLLTEPNENEIQNEKTNAMKKQSILGSDGVCLGLNEFCSFLYNTNDFCSVGKKEKKCLYNSFRLISFF